MINEELSKKICTVMNYILISKDNIIRYEKYKLSRSVSNPAKIILLHHNNVYTDVNKVINFLEYYCQSDEYSKLFIK